MNRVMRFDITLLTEVRHPDLTSDDRLLRGALEARGATVRAAIWNDPAVDWSASAVTVFRSTWDYFHHIREFAEWLDVVELQTRLVNDGKTVRWNMHKGYLRDLAERGVPIVPTLFVDHGDHFDLSPPQAPGEWSDVVIKPCVSGSSFGAARFDLRTATAEAQSHLQSLVAVRDTMVQPYLAAVETERERSLIFFDGSYSHAIRKTPFTAWSAGATDLRHDASAEEIAFGRGVLGVLDTMPAYARVDIVPADGSPLLMELEVIEPSLFFDALPGSEDALAEILLRDVR